MDISGVPDFQVMLDGTLVHRMIDNVISNALRFARHEIALKAGWQEGVLTIQVYDDGAGFSEESSAQPQGRFTKRIRKMTTSGWASLSATPFARNRVERSL